MYNPNTSPLAGMSKPQLEAALNTAQNAYIQLMTGTRGVEFSYAQGDGARSVKYDQLDLQQLLQFINMLKLQLGMPTQRRRPLKFRYTRG
ncbi:gpW family protein [Acinetobacter higginsii]|uniref:gpW family protein n=1 Tax=Acinetobacter higginsii TaxID=70347 RepID=UPI001F4B167D|nr:gpW family protein [Acinetobacter higginsii]MCH7381382.1 gpW family protein [Acinetobacter higginsii]